MKSSKSHSLRRSVFVGALFLITVNTFTHSRTAASPGRELTERNLLRISNNSITFPNYGQLSPTAADEVTSSFTEHRRMLINVLIWQLNNKNLTNHAKAKAISLLGAFRAKEAVGVLVKDINFKDETLYPPSAVVPDTYTVRSALIDIGLPASNAILRIIGIEDKGLLFSELQAEGYAKVLFSIDGPRYGLLKLQDRQKEATDPAIKAQIQLVIDEFEKVLKQTHENFR